MGIRSNYWRPIGFLTNYMHLLVIIT
jgi:hypothetical protein